MILSRKEEVDEEDNDESENDASEEDLDWKRSDEGRSVFEVRVVVVTKYWRT